MRLLDAFFRLSPFNPDATPKLIWEHHGYGKFSFTIPDAYNRFSIKIEISGAGGGNHCGFVNQSDNNTWIGGNGELYTYTFENAKGNVISGFLGQGGVYVSSPKDNNGGEGYVNGEPGQLINETLWIKAGGGGGSSSLLVDGVFCGEASGGGGMNYLNLIGGNGGGPNGGAGGQSAGNGLGAKGAFFQRQGNNNTASEDGYIKIYYMS